ncbi:MAG TPA: SprT family zinc-dependent metalloprotease [Verrucomicrobiae bacterium]
MPSKDTAGLLQVGERTVTLHLVRHPRARRYVMRLRSNGAVHVTVPRSGTIAAAMAFAERNTAWLERQLQRLAGRPSLPLTWHLGTEIFLRGAPVRLELAADGEIRFGAEVLRVPDPAADLRPAIQKHLQALAARELPPRVIEFASRHGLVVSRVTVRNQKARWGSCSRTGAISLNWRLIQLPQSVCDYIILHELAHRRHLNHSASFWAEVERLCPDYRQAERWLKQHSFLLR